MSLGYPAPLTVGQPSNFDISGISAAIDRAAASLKPSERGSLTVQLDDKGAGAGLIVRGPSYGPFKTRALATVTKPYAGRFGWAASFQASFLMGEPPKPVRVAPELRGLYRLFRQRGYGKITAVVKSVQVSRGQEVRVE